MRQPRLRHQPVLNAVPRRPSALAPRQSPRVPLGQWRRALPTETFPPHALPRQDPMAVWLRIVRPNSSSDDECTVVSLPADSPFEIYLVGPLHRAPLRYSIAAAAYWIHAWRAAVMARRTP